MYARLDSVCGCWLVALYHGTYAFAAVPNCRGLPLRAPLVDTTTLCCCMYQVPFDIPGVVFETRRPLFQSKCTMEAVTYGWMCIQGQSTILLPDDICLYYN